MTAFDLIKTSLTFIEEISEKYPHIAAVLAARVESYMESDFSPGCKTVELNVDIPKLLSLVQECQHLSIALDQ